MTLRDTALDAITEVFRLTYGRPQAETLAAAGRIAMTAKRRSQGDGTLFKRADCLTCRGPCRLTTNGVPMNREGVIDDLLTCQERWYKARREERYFRAERWAQSRDLCLDHLTSRPMPLRSLRTRDSAARTMRTILATVLLTTALLTATPAHADPEGDYLGYLANTPGVIGGPLNNAIYLAAGHHACDLLRAGTTPQDTEGQLTVPVYVQPWLAHAMVNAAQHTLCKDTLR